MIQLTRYCTGCADERPFEQMHEEPGSCPDVLEGANPDVDCPEWGCPACGEALFIGLPVREHVSGATVSRAA
jgi:hypothetical protein